MWPVVRPREPNGAGDSKRGSYRSSKILVEVSKQLLTMRPTIRFQFIHISHLLKLHWFAETTRLQLAYESSSCRCGL